MRPTIPDPRRLATLLLVLPALAGCFNESDENTNEGIDASPGETVVEVRLTDDSIEMPDEIPMGPAVFEVTNTGTAPHGFAIDGTDGAIDSLLSDGLETLRVELEPGDYTVYSPVDGDRDAGLERTLTVTEREGADGDAPAEGVEGGEQEDLGDDY